MSTTRLNGHKPAKDLTDLRDKVGSENLVKVLFDHAENEAAAAKKVGGTIPPAVCGQDEPAATRTPAGTPTEWLDAFTHGVLGGDELGQLKIKPRERLFSHWLCEGDLGYVYAARGVGKTWFALLMAVAVAEGGEFGPWTTAAKHSVLYIDGEMPLELMQIRHQAVCQGAGLIHYLNHEQLFDQTGQVLNLTAPACQEAIITFCLRTGVKLLVIDNLSCLFRDVRENDSHAWELILPWLLELRRRRIAVIFVVHAGRNGMMRGTSRREDPAAWTIRLDDAAIPGSARDDARFVSSFTKPARNLPTPAPLEWRIYTDPKTGRASVTHKPADGEDAVLAWVCNGLTACSDIAREMGLTPGAVSKLARKLIDAGKLVKRGRDYALANEQAGEEPAA